MENIGAPRKSTFGVPTRRTVRKRSVWSASPEIQSDERGRLWQVLIDVHAIGERFRPSGMEGAFVNCVIRALDWGQAEEALPELMASLGLDIDSIDEVVELESTPQERIHFDITPAPISLELPQIIEHWYPAD